MKATETIISTLRDAPADAVIASHKFMIRAGLIRKLGNGLYAYMPMGLRSFRKIENIIREELDDAGFLEMKPPVIVPGDIWRESGRWETMGSEMLRMKTRGGQEMVVSPTAEETFTALFRSGLESYKQLPINVYQINTKYRDEIRPRYGVMRGREFVMMDGYSFDADGKSLDESYRRWAKAYRRIFKRMGISAISVRADTGAMGGSGSEEFMVESAVGDNTLILCPKCGYAANVEKAACAPDFDKGSVSKMEMERVKCPGVESIAQMEVFFKMPARKFIKVLVYEVHNSSLDLRRAQGRSPCKQEKSSSGGYCPKCFFAVAIRGDLDVNEAKLAAALKAGDVVLACEADVINYSNAPHGFVGPVGLEKIPLLADESIMAQREDGTFDVHIHDAVTGGNEKDVDIMHVEPCRDFVPFITADVRTVKQGDICPDCGDELYIKKGNELGHIFKLGDKYTKSMKVECLDESGRAQTPVMGCYGIGLDRTLASVIEEHHDENGIIWTMSTAPYHVVIIPIKYSGKMKDVADDIYCELASCGIEVLLDDRNERPGVKFKDADLIGFPVRIVIGDKNLPDVELKKRESKDVVLLPSKDAAKRAAEIVHNAMAALDG